MAKPSLAATTIRSYECIIKKKIIPYFEGKKIPLASLKPLDLQKFYPYELQTISGGSAIHEHSVIHKALEYAVRMELIDRNPADRVERPKEKKYVADYYRGEELARFLEATNDHKYGLLYQTTAFYGFRRSEVLGLKWNAIDFENNTISIQHTVTETRAGGKQNSFFPTKRRQNPATGLCH